MNESWIRRVWRREGFFAGALWLALLPPSWLYGLAVMARNAGYAMGWMPRRSLERPVVSVGNLTVGGTGKTPTTLWLAQELRKRGLRVAILSRGYKRKDGAPVVLEPGAGGANSASVADELALAGDEPLMMARIFGQKVGIGEQRFEAGVEILKSADVDVFLLDDGYQHRELSRDVDLLLLGAEADGRMLPAGPFREPKRALRRANLYLITGSVEKWKSRIRSRDSSAIFVGRLRATTLIGRDSDRWKEHPLSLLDRSKIVAVSAIADAGLFYRMIDEWEGEIVAAIEFPDHHEYTPADWQRISRAARHVDLIVTTEKDIVKLNRFPFARDKLLALRVEMTVENGDALVEAVGQAIAVSRPKP